jgi:hypothetical protein
MFNQMLTELLRLDLEEFQDSPEEEMKAIIDKLNSIETALGNQKDIDDLKFVVNQINELSAHMISADKAARFVLPFISSDVCIQEQREKKWDKQGFEDVFDSIYDELKQIMNLCNFRTGEVEDCITAFDKYSSEYCKHVFNYIDKKRVYHSDAEYVESPKTYRNSIKKTFDERPEKGNSYSDYCHAKVEELINC